jgi:glycosyltransferase involved in cell wall biosynthesis
MIRPYKGVPDLIRAFQQVVQGNENHGLHLIIAGQLQDSEVSETLDRIETKTRKCISFVARRLREEELASLMRLAHVSITPYKRILTSGSYFLATTFAKPTVAPRKGMFAEIMKNGESGFLYDGSIDELTKLLTHISILPEAELVRLGENALKSCQHLTISEVSKRFFSLLESSK